MRVGISGHQRLQDSDVWEWVRKEMRERLASLPSPIVGITSLAVGADSIFAEIILELGGSLEVVVPFNDYEDKFAEGADRRHYRNLLSRANKVEVLDRYGTDGEAYYAAGKRMADQSTLLIFVWDGLPAAGIGGTGDIAEYARHMQKEIIHLNPLTRTVTP